LQRQLNSHDLGFEIGIAAFAQGELDKIVDEFNNRPRKILGYLIPHEVFSP
jgi:IS30 family transposase